MRVAIVGMGVAGSYLAARLGEEHKVVGFERSSEENHDAVCAWGTCKQAIAQLVKPTGLNFEDYVLHEGSVMLVDIGGETLEIKLRGLCTYDKLQLIKDLLQDREIRYGVHVKGGLDGGYDLVIDATGLHRPLLPKIKGDMFVPCVQYKVRFGGDPPYEDFYIKPFPSLSGYFWYFPLGGRYAHVGGGDFYKRHNEELQAFLRRHGGEVLKKVGRPIRLTPPSRCQPFYEGNVVGVGESIGTVYPLVGEGIIPSLQCAELLVQNLGSLGGYRDAVLRKFGFYDTVYKVIVSAIRGNFSVARSLLSLLRIFIHMKRHEGRYGLKVSLSDILKVSAHLGSKKLLTPEG